MIRKYRSKNCPARSRDSALLELFQRGYVKDQVLKALEQHAAEFKKNYASHKEYNARCD